MLTENYNASNGFTLLELLVAIGIIVVIVSMGFVSYSTAQKTARDAKRKSDLKAIQNSLEQYYSVCGYQYPNPAAGNAVPTIICTTPPTADILTETPKDPLTGSDYSMTGGSSSYSICGPNTPPLETDDIASYCLTNRQ